MAINPLLPILIGAIQTRNVIKDQNEAEYDEVTGAFIDAAATEFFADKANQKERIKNNEKFYKATENRYGTNIAEFSAKSNLFDGYNSPLEFLRAIDSADPSIVSSNVRPRMFQKITANTTTNLNNFTLQFAEPFYSSGESTKFILSSTAFKTANNQVEDHFFGDVPISGSDKRKVIVYKIVNGQNITVINDAGELDVANGKITLHSFNTNGSTNITLTVVPNSLDIAPKRNEILAIDTTKIAVTIDIDTIAVSGSSGAITYNTNSRIK